MEKLLKRRSIVRQRELQGRGMTYRYFPAASAAAADTAIVVASNPSVAHARTSGDQSGARLTVHNEQRRGWVLAFLAERKAAIGPEVRTDA